MPAAALKRAGARRLYVTRDDLSLGPSALEPRRHQNRRNAFWQVLYRALPRPEGARFRTGTFREPPVDATLKRERGRPITLWLGGRWSDTLFAAQMAYGMRRVRIPAPIHVASSARLWPLFSEEYGRTLAVFRPDELQDLYTQRQPLKERGLNALANLWESFVEGELGALQKRFEHWTGLAPIFPLAPDTHELIPRATAARDPALYLSSYDALLLGMYRSKAWQNVLSRIREHDARDAFMSLMRISGDMVISFRLEQWARHAPHLLERRLVEPATSFMNVVEYRLTDAGERVRVDGLRDPSEAPPLPTGGYVAYAPEPSWVCVSGRHVRWRPRRA